MKTISTISFSPNEQGLKAGYIRPECIHCICVAVDAPRSIQTVFFKQIEGQLINRARLKYLQ